MPTGAHARTCTWHQRRGIGRDAAARAVVAWPAEYCVVGPLGNRQRAGAAGRDRDWTPRRDRAEGL